MTQPASGAWGDSSRHYAGPDLPASRSDSTDASLADLGKKWSRLLEAAMPGARRQVEQSVRQWNSILRDQVRTETALRLSVGTQTQAVPVRICDGLPRPFAERLVDFADSEWLILNRPDVEATARGAQLIADNHASATQIVSDDGVVSSAETLAGTARTAALLLKQLDRLDAIKRIVDCQEDVMGAYFFRTPEIRIYWVPIGIIARLLGVPVDAVTVVVLTHELAHAYSHLGRDIDNETWSTDSFAKTDMDVVEGIALIKRHTRKNQQHPQGAIVEREGTVHISNLMKAGTFDARLAKRGAGKPATP